MDLASRKEIFIFAVLIGYVQASTPYITEKDPPNYISIAEDFNGTICRFHVIDSDNDDTVTVRPADDFTMQYFNIITDGGTNNVWVNVTVKKPLDRETVGMIVKIQLSVKDLQHNEIYYELTIYMSDVNDNHPEFHDLPYTLEIDELPCNETTVYEAINATDKDSGPNGKIRYTMTPKTQLPELQQMYNETFSIDPLMGIISLKSCLDYESNSYYHFMVIAQDTGPNGGLSSTAEFIIYVKDVQDEPPFFTGIYRKTIKENTPKGSEVARVHAVDGDPGVSNKIYYSITYSSCGDGLFIINNETGVIYTIRDIDRNSGTIRQQSGYCTVTVEANEIEDINEPQYGNTTASTNVTITLQDFIDNQLTTTDVSGHVASTPQPTQQTLPRLNCTELWNFQSPCNESTIQAGITKFPHPASHHKFLICDASGKTYSANCPPNEVFNAACSSCALPLQKFSASCQLFKNGFTSPCSKENIIAGNLTFSYPNSSTKYIRCDTLGNAWVEECLSGSVWDQANLICALPAAYNPCHRRGSMIQSLFPHYCNPRLFVQCGNNQQPFVHTCQKNYVFLQWDLTCVPPGFPGSEHLRYTCN